MIQYRCGQIPEIHAVVALLEDSHTKRPVHDHAALKRMLEGSNILHEAYLGSRLVGLLRGWTDGVCEGFLCDLVVHPDVAKEGIADEFLRQLSETYLFIRWWFPDAASFHLDLGRLGWKKVPQGWVLFPD